MKSVARPFRILFAVGLCASVAPPAFGTFHFVQIEQVIWGVDDNLAVQAIQLRMRSGLQNLVSAALIRAWDAEGMNPVVIIDFSTNVAVSTAGSRILIASDTFADFTSPSVNPDFIMTNTIPYFQAGSLTFEDNLGTIRWRLSWGSDDFPYTGPTTGSSINDADGDFGPPFPQIPPVVSGQAVLFQGSFSALSTTNEADYALTPGVAEFTNNAGATFTVVAAQLGACCDDATGICEQSVSEADCLDSGRRHGGFGSSCASIDPPCEGPTGACCDDSTGECTEGLTQAVCEEFGQRYGGDDSTCATIDPACLEPVGACCDDSVAGCTIETQSACASAGRRFGGNGTDCASIDPSCDVPLGACCDEATGICTDLIGEAECDLAVLRYGGDGSDCGSIDPPCEADRVSIRLLTVASGLISPVGVTHAGDGSGRLFIVDQAGFIRVVDVTDSLVVAPFLDLTAIIVPLDANFDERGLLGLAFHPDYANNGRFFVRYSADRVGSAGEPCFGTSRGCHKEVLSEFSVIGDPAVSNTADPSSEIILFEIDEPQFNHDAGEIAFGPDGLLYFSLGDGGGANDGLADGEPPGSEPSHGPFGHGQDTDTALGSMLRVDVDCGTPPYCIPASNPFATGGGVPEIYAWGFRNPYKFSFDDGPGGTGALYLADVGQALFEEVDIVVNGGNYGWVIKEGTHCFDPLDSGVPPAICDDAGMIDPIMEYAHPRAGLPHAGGLAIVGGFVYRGSGLPELSGKYVFGDFSSDFGPTGRMFYFDTTGPDANQRREFKLGPADPPFGRILKGFGEDEEGELYVTATDILGPNGDTGTVQRLVAPPSCLPSTQPGTDSIAKLRFLSIEAGDIGQNQAIRVTFLNLPEPYAIWNGTQMWVQAPEEFCENSGVARPPCVFGATVKAATLGCAPHYMDWTTVGVVAVYHEGIISDATYPVQVVDQSCGIGDEVAFSSSLTMDTPLWGDCCGPQGDPPDLRVDITVDVTQILDKFKNLEGAISILRADLEPKDVDFVNNFADVVFDLDAFSGDPYPFSPSGDPPCP